MKTQVLRPGLLVSLRTSIVGAVAYKRVDIEAEHADESGGRRARWETTRIVRDAAAFEAATAVRGRARSIVTALCSPSSFGLLCPASREAELAAAIDEARAISALHNAGSPAQVQVYCITGRIAQDDVEAARAISAEMRELLDAMLAGIAKADPEAIREAANKARALGQMLTRDAAAQVETAISDARRIARELVKRVEKAGEVAAQVVTEGATRRIESARFAFLDLDAPADVTPSEPAARPIDLDAAAPIIAQAPQSRALELEA